MRSSVLCLVAMLVPAMVHAQDISLVDPNAKVHLDAGVQHFNDKQYALAVSEFEAGYKIEPDVIFLFAWAQSERLRGNCAAAAPLYKRLIASHPNVQQETVARHHLAACEALFPRPWYKDPVGDTLVLAGLVGVGAGIGLFFASANNETDAGHAADYRNFYDHSSTAQREHTSAIVVLSIGAGLAAAGVLELALGNRHPRREAHR